MILDQTYTMSNGVTIPKLGLGTWFIHDEQAAEAVRQAISLGYRHIDTAQAYGNERGVGEGVRTSGVDRTDLFVTTKLAAELKNHDDAVAAIDGSLAALGLNYIDLMLIHSPQPWDDFRGGDYAEGNRQAWRALEEAHQAGKLRAIGVSNFLQADLENILASCTTPPQANQLLVHAGNTPDELIEYCAGHSILVEAYSPIGHGVILQNAELQALAGKYATSVAQLCIRYVIQLGTVALPKTADPDHMRTNAEVDFEIAAPDMAVLRGLHVRDYGEHSRFPVFNGR